MPKQAKGSNNKKLATLLGSNGYGYGLYLLVRGPRIASWVFRYTATVGGRKVRREMGLGPAYGPLAVSVTKAREKALTAYVMVHEGKKDPVAEKQQVKVEQVISASQTKTFKVAVEAFLKQRESKWRSDKHREQFESTLVTYAYPVLGKLPVSAITTPLVLRVLDPIWATKTPTASRVRSRIERVLDFSTARGWRTGDNPASWKGAIKGALGDHGREGEKKHHAALPYADLPAFWIELGEQPGLAVKALRFTILTASRTGETVGARWPEIDRAAKLWTIPPERMKSKRAHVVPLSEAALAILDEMEPLRQEGDFVFPGQWEGVGMSDASMFAVLRRMKRRDITVHGFRSTFRDFAGDETNHPREVAEAALAHAVGDATEAAYRRGSALEKRRLLMEQWATHCTTPPAARGKVVSMAGRRP